MATITPILRIAKLGNDGKAPVWVRISDAASTRYISTRIKIRKTEWNPAKQRVNKRHVSHVKLNAIIAVTVRSAEEALLNARLEGVEPTADDLKAAILKPKAGDFFAFAKGAIERMERHGQADSARRYRFVVFSKLRGFTGTSLPFDRLNVRLLRDWETSMIERGNAAGTVATAFRAVRSIYNKAIAEGLGNRNDSPFLNFRLAPVPRPVKAKLTNEEMQAIEDVNLEVGSKTWHARNAFVFSFYCAGMRFKDVCLLRRGDLHQDGGGWRVHYTTAKSFRNFALKVPQRAADIAVLYGLGDAMADPEEYLFPFLRDRDVSTPERLRRVKDSRNVTVNKQLKKIARLAGVETNVSFHIARHSFADLARVRGIDLHTISKALGHSSLKVTEIYLKGFDQHALDGAMDELFGGME